MFLPDITIQLLKFYEKIFQFWNSGHECFLSNSTLMDYCGMKSDSTVSSAFQYFEEKKEMKRAYKDGKRYIIPPQPKVTTESEKLSAENIETPSLQRDPPPRCSET